MEVIAFVHANSADPGPKVTAHCSTECPLTSNIPGRRVQYNISHLLARKSKIGLCFAQLLHREAGSVRRFVPRSSDVCAPRRREFCGVAVCRGVAARSVLRFHCCLFTVARARPSQALVLHSLARALYRAALRATAPPSYCRSG